MSAAGEERLESLRELLADDPQSPFLRYGVAMQLKALGRTEEALAEFADLVADSPDYVPTYYHYAGLLHAQGDERALELARRGVEQARAAGDRHAEAELHDLIDELDA